MRYFSPISLLALVALTACSSQIQSTSGADYLAARPFADPTLAALAATEPTLSFPARIGVARLYDGALTLPPAAEADLWEDLFARAASFGSFVPLTPLMMTLAGDGSGSRYAPFDLARAQALGARQHLDYVMIVDLTGSEGVAQTAFVDVRTGYPYGLAQAAISGGEVTNIFGGLPRNPARRDRATLALTQALLPEIEEMLGGLAAAARP